MVAQMPRGASHLDRGVRSVRVPCETVINGNSLRSMMDQRCNFPGFSTSAAWQEGWHPARRSGMPLSQLPSRKSTSIHQQNCHMRWDHGCSALPMMPGLVHPPTHHQPGNVPTTETCPWSEFRWLDGSRALAMRYCWMAESDSVNQPLNPWASHSNAGSGDDGPLWIWRELQPAFRPIYPHLRPTENL